MSGPVVGVIIPTHNRAPLVGRAVRSALSQTYQNLEVIVIDDRSTDDTAATLQAIADPRLHVVTAERRLGVADVRNRGIELTSSRYVAFLDDDDEWLEPKVERQLAAFEGPEPPALVYTGLWIDDGTNRRYGVMELGEKPFERLLSFPGPVTTSGFMVDRERVNGGGLWFDPSVATFEDGELLLRIGKGWPIALISEPLYVWHHHDGPRASEPQGQVRARRRIIEKYAQELAVRPRTSAYHSFRLAIAESRVGDWVAVRSSLLAAAAADPSNLRLRLLGRAALGPRTARLVLAGYRWLGRICRALRLPDRRFQGRAS